MNQQTYRRTLRSALVAVILTLGGLAFVSSAQAVPSAAPEIVSQPSNPNTTQGIVTFQYTVGAGETSTVSPLRFYCRTYPTATPPSASSGWAACGLSTDTQPSSRVLAGLANGNLTFQVAAREVSAIGTQGPISTFSWAQNVAVPTKAPTLTLKPTDPQVEPESVFEFSGGSGEETIPTGYQCRFNSSSDTAWTACNNGRFSNKPGNGTHTFQVRAIHPSGGAPGPITSTQWDVDVPNVVHPSVRLADVASTTWLGTKTNDLLGSSPQNYFPRGGVQNAGDVNGDGKNDLLANGMDGASTLREVLVVFSSGNVSGPREITSMGSGGGYAMTTKAPVGKVHGVAPVGDQNGDGVADFSLVYLNGATPVVSIVYGISNPSSLPKCDPGKALRCLDIGSLSSEQGYSFSDTSPNMYGFGSAGANAGDFDGDGVTDIALGSATSNSLLVIKGGTRTGTIDPLSIPDSEVLKVFASGAGVQGFGIAPVGVGDLNGDGKDDLFADAGVPSGAVVYGRSFSDPDLDATSMTGSDGRRSFNETFAGTLIQNVGDINGDGLPDLGTGSNFAGITGLVNIIYGTDDPASNPIIAGPSMPPGSGYFVDGSGQDLGGAIQNLGDLNNDGTPDQLVSAPASTVSGIGTGAAYVLFGQRETPSDPLLTGAALEPNVGVALFGSSDFEKAGHSVAGLGDVDGDGLPDLAISASRFDSNGISDVGAVYIVSGRKLMSTVKLADEVRLTNTEAGISGSVVTGGNDTEVKVEYGTSDDYGSSTAVRSVDGGESGKVLSFDLSGLTKNTTYHYRTVATNSLGLTRYGDDQTFTTTNTDPVSNCDTDNSLPGCPGFDPCAADDTKPGCPGYNHCAVKPADCAGGSSNAKLAIVSVTKKIQVKRGKRGVHQVAVINTGGKAASGVKVCVKAPKKLVKVKRCFKVGSLGSGASRTVKIKVQAKRKRGKAVLNLTASGNSLSAKKTKATVVIR